MTSPSDKHGETLAAIEKAQRFINEMCQGQRRWGMSVPADLENDPDIVIMDALVKAHNALRAPVSATAPNESAAVAALQRLCDLKAMKAALETQQGDLLELPGGKTERRVISDYYEQNKEPAWTQARAALASAVPSTEPTRLQTAESILRQLVEAASADKLEDYSRTSNVADMADDFLRGAPAPEMASSS